MEEKESKRLLAKCGVGSKQQGSSHATNKNLNRGFKAYLRRVGNPDMDRAVLKREGMDQEQGGNSDSKGLEVVEHHIRYSRLELGLDRRD